MKIPEWFGCTERQWKTKKRSEMKQLIRTLDVFRAGCAYTPVYQEFKAASDVIRKMQEVLSVKSWGR